jgi:hypothetical protein
MMEIQKNGTALFIRNRHASHGCKHSFDGVARHWLLGLTMDAG